MGTSNYSDDFKREAVIAGGGIFRSQQEREPRHGRIR